MSAISTTAWPRERLRSRLVLLPWGWPSAVFLRDLRWFRLSRICLTISYWHAVPLVVVVNGRLVTEHSGPLTLTEPGTLLPWYLLNTRQTLPALSVVPVRTSPRITADTLAPPTFLPRASVTWTLTYGRWLSGALYALMLTE